MSSLPITITLPGLSRRSPTHRKPVAAEFLHAPWHWLRSRRHQTLRLTARIRRAAAKGQPILLGTSVRPWSPSEDATSMAASPLASLKAFRGLEIRVTTRSLRFLQNLEVLIDLDRNNAVHVDVLMPDTNLRRRQAQEGLGLVRHLAREGIQTRVLVPATHLVRASGDCLRRLFEAARGAGAFDVLVSGKRADAPWMRRFERLRLQHGFPLPQPGRG